jgi:thiosulfate/3-mercaptopyruvate sulfurtransferase
MQILVDAQELKSLPGAVILDARFRLKDAVAENLFLESHIPGAQYVDLERDLSGAKNGRNGRHPLPSREALAKTLGRLGIGPDTPVVTYDDTDHAGAGRLWMMLRWMGHEKVQVLHGGLKAWIAAGYPLESGEPSPREAREFPLRSALVSVLKIDQLAGKNLVDARAPERYRGEVEPLDPKAGHIPGAKNLFYSTLLGPDGKFLPAQELREKILSVTAAPTFYCGSGVTATVPLLAAEIAGIPAELYAGSWSEWSQQPDRPVESGNG